MSLKHVASNTFHCLRIALASLALFQFTIGASLASAAPQQGPSTPGNNDGKTVTPIKHLVVIIGENRSFDHVFATYVPKPGQTVNNLLSEGIITLDANKNAIPGPHFDKARQLSASDLGSQDAFLLSPPKQEFPGNVLPAPEAGGPSGVNGYFTGSNPCHTPKGQTPLTPVQCAMVTEDGLPSEAYYSSLASGGTGQYSYTPDLRIANFYNLPAGPFQLTNGTNTATPGYSLTYTDYSASPVHRFYQMWQQENCSLEHATWDNPSGCDAKLFAWVEATVGAGTNGLSQAQYAQSYYGPSFSEFFTYPQGYSATNPPTEAEWTANKYALYDSVPTTTGEGSTALGFYNVQQGDVPYFKSLADTYAMSDNFHQSVDGGTGANHIMFGHADAIWFSDGNGHPEVPPHNVGVTTNPAGYGGTGIIDQIENPNPAQGTNNWYSQDGYGSDYNAGYPSYDWTTTQPNGLPIIYGGGSYSDCSDPRQPGVGPIVAYLHQLHIDPRCQAGHFYLLNNYNPGYFGQGENAYTDQNPSSTPFTIPPSSTPSIGDDLIAHNISWKYYGDQWNRYAGTGNPNQPACSATVTTNCYIAEDKYQLNWGYNGATADEYCNICNPFQYDTSIMANQAVREAHIQDTANLYNDIQNNSLPAVSIVKPSGYTDGHPASSKLDIFEGFTEKIVDMIENSPYASDTAIFITEDEGGGYYDSGYVQPLDFFGDGTRIIFLVVSPFSKGGKIAHNYADHVSIDKFIERNWSLPPITNRSRDNFPNPVAEWGNPYVPINGPAISDLFELFNFPSTGGGH